MRLPVEIHFTIREPIRILGIIYWIEVAGNCFRNLLEIYFWVDGVELFVINEMNIEIGVCFCLQTFYIDRMSHFFNRFYL